MTQNSFVTLDTSSFVSHAAVRALLAGNDFWYKGQLDRTIEEWSGAFRNKTNHTNLLAPYGSPLRLKGQIREVPFVVVFYLLGTAKSSGLLQGVSGRDTFQFQFHKGRIVGLGARKITQSMEALLVRSNLLKPSILPQMRDRAAQKRVSLFEYLIQSKRMTPEQYHHLVQAYAVESMITLLSWRDGRFEFIGKQVRPKGRIQIEPLDLIINTARRCFSHDKFEKSIDGQNVIFRVSPHLDQTRNIADLGLGQLEEYVFSLINGTRNLTQIVRLSGLSEIQVVSVIYQIALRGLIRRSKEMIVYEDKEYAELAKVISTIFEVHQIITSRLLFELGDAGKAYIDEAASRLSVKDQKLFANIAIDLSRPLNISTILKNITLMSASFEQRFDFIEAFCYLDKQILYELLNFLGPELARDTIEQVKEKASNIRQFAMETALRDRLYVALTDAAAANLEG